MMPVKPLMRIACAVFLGSLATFTNAAAQTPPKVCMDGPAFRQFDFWVGKWDVYNNANGNLNYRSSRSFEFRGTWTPNEDGTVRQFFEQKNPASGEWQVWFDGRYEPRD